MCEARGWHYLTFEQSFLRFLRKVDLKHVLGGERQDQLIASLRQRTLSLEAEIAKQDQSIANLIASVEVSGAAGPLLAARANELAGSKAENQRSLLEVRNAVDVAERQQQVMSREEIEALIEKVSDKEANAKDDSTRRLLASEIKRVVSKVELASGPLSQPWDSVDEEELRWLEELKPWERQLVNSHYVIHYVTGEKEYVEPISRRSVVFGQSARRPSHGRFS